MSNRGVEVTVKGTTGGWTEVRCPSCGRKQMIYAFEIARGILETVCNDTRCKAAIRVVFAEANPERSGLPVEGIKKPVRQTMLPDGYEMWRCPHCHHPISWPATMPGREIECPGCRNRIKIGR